MRRIRSHISRQMHQLIASLMCDEIGEKTVKNKFHHSDYNLQILNIYRILGAISHRFFSFVHFI